VWFWIWTVLILATLAGAFFLGRQLWRQTVALGRELARAGEVAGRLAVRVDELRAIAEREAPDTSPTVLAEIGPLLDRVADLGVRAAGRRVERYERHRRTRRGWRAYWS
jgi:hypothetical protein